MLRLWPVGLFAPVVGILAASSTGWARLVLLVFLVGLGLYLAVAVSRHPVAPAVQAAGGPGYEPPLKRRVQLLHVALVLAYVAGIGVVVLAAMSRLGFADAEFNPAVVSQFPLLLGMYAALLALAAHWRIRDHRGIIRNWATRGHGIALGIVAGFVVLGTLAVMRVGSLSYGGITFLQTNDIDVWVLVALLGVGTQMFLTAGLPTVIELAAILLRLAKPDPQAVKRGTPPVVYALMLALAGTILVAFLVDRLGLVQAIGNFQDERVALLVVIFPIGVALFLGISAYQIVREAKRGLYQKKLSPVMRNRILVYTFSSLMGMVGVVLLAMNFSGQLPTVFGIEPGLTLAKDIIMFTVLATAGPVGHYLQRQTRRRRAIEDRLPDFLNDLAESKRAGLTLTAALQSVSLADYGPLSEEIKKMANQVAWGVSFNDAFSQMAARVRSPLVERIAFLVIEASRSGGSVSEILKAAARDAYEIQSLDQERRVSMTTYLIVMYVVFFVFIAVLGIMDATFIAKVIEANQAIAASGELAAGSPVGGAEVDGDSIRFAYYLSAAVQGMGNGIVAGVLTEGRVSSGLRHAAIMVVCAWLVFRVALGG